MLGLVTIGLILVALRRRASEQAAALVERQTQLEEQATELEEQASELEEQATELESQTEELQDTVRELGRKNDELNAFSSSVAHDLRSPLRSIDGFSHLLLTDYAPRLDDSGVKALKRIRVECATHGRAHRRTAHARAREWQRATKARRELFGDRSNPPATTSCAALPADRSIDYLVHPDLAVRGDTRLLRVARAQPGGERVQVHARAFRCARGGRGERSRTASARSS